MARAYGMDDDRNADNDNHCSNRMLRMKKTNYADIIIIPIEIAVIALMIMVLIMGIAK